MLKYYCKNFSEQNLGFLHTKGTQGNSGNFQVEENLRQTHWSFNFFYKIWEKFKKIKFSGKFFAKLRMRFN